MGPIQDRVFEERSPLQSAKKSYYQLHTYEILKSPSSIVAMGEQQSVLRRAYDVSFQGLMALVERDVVPDWLIRRGIRYLLSQRVADVRHSCRYSHRSKDFTAGLRPGS